MVAPKCLSIHITTDLSDCDGILLVDPVGSSYYSVQRNHKMILKLTVRTEIFSKSEEI